MKANVITVSLFIVLLIPIDSFSVTIYVSPTGNDTNEGTRKRPLASLNGAIKKLRSFDNINRIDEPIEIIVGDGEYYLTEPLILTSEDSGEDELPVIFKAEEGKCPIIYGGKKIDRFEQISETLWRSKIPEVTNQEWYFEQLYVNNKPAVRAKSPNFGFYFIEGVSETILHMGFGRAPELTCQKFILSNDGKEQLSSFSKEDFNDAIVTFYHRWDNTRKNIDSFEKDSSAIYIVGQGMKPWNRIDTLTRYSLENYKSALDSCGEWFLDRSGYLFYIPRIGETVDNTIAIAPVLTQLIILKGNQDLDVKVRNIRFEGLSFQVSGYKTPKKGNDPAQAASPVDAAIMIDYAENIQFVNCKISNTGNNAIWFRNACNNCLIQHCYLHDLGAGGIKIGSYIKSENPDNLTNNITVDNNIVRSGGFVFPCAVGITLFHASDNRITHNDIANFRYSGVSVGWVWGYKYSPSKRNKIEFNHIHHLGWGELCDMGGVYCLGESEGTTVSNNVIHHIYSFNYGGWGLYTDEGSIGITMENNLIYRCKSAGFHQHYGKENIIRNNIFAFQVIAQLAATRFEDHTSFFFTNNIVYFDRGTLIDKSGWAKLIFKAEENLYWDTRTKDLRFGEMTLKEWQKLTGKDKNSIVADPLFVDPSKNDFRLKNESVTSKINFIPFDYTIAGVYGEEAWKQLALFPVGLANEFDKVVEQRLATYKQ